MLKIAGKLNFQCNLRYLEGPNQTHIKMKKCFSNETRNPNNESY